MSRMRRFKPNRLPADHGGMTPKGRTHRSRALVALAGLTLAAGCSSAPPDAGNPAPGAATNANVSAAVPDTMRPEFPDAAPGEKQLPAPVLRAVRGPLESWTLAWHDALPTLRLDQFARSEVVPFVPDDEGPFVGGVEGTDLRLLYL